MTKTTSFSFAALGAAVVMLGSASAYAAPLPVPETAVQTAAGTQVQQVAYYGWDQHRDGPRYRYRNGPYRHYYHGYYYRTPWWTVPGVGVGVVVPGVTAGGRCNTWAHRCANRYGWRNHDWRGCMRYHGC
ncbi:MAG: hypothetical protein U1E46_14415 [Hyphomicrobiales bacterium]